MESMKIPPLDNDVLQDFAEVTPLLTSEWQSLQDPSRVIDDPNEGKYLWNGTFIPNPLIEGHWKGVGQVNHLAEYQPNKEAHRQDRGPFSDLVLKKNGKTNNPQAIWTDAMLLDLAQKQAMEMKVETIQGKDYLFLEAGGFSDERPLGWRCPYLVFERQ